MAWIESHQTLRHHPKIKKLSRKLGVSIPAAIGHLHCLWWWALDYADDGDLSRYDKEDIADAAMWDVEDADTFVEAMSDAGLLDNTGNGYVLHDWDDYAGKLIERREANRERQRLHRERKKQRNSDVTVTNASRNIATVPNPTVPNPTNKTHAQAHAGVSAKKAKRTRFVNKLFEEQFWEIYPRKRAKQEALKAFQSLFPVSLSKEQCNKRWQNIVHHIDALVAEARPPDKLPYPATFLRRESFDEPPAEMTSSNVPEMEFVEVEADDE